MSQAAAQESVTPLTERCDEAYKKVWECRNCGHIIVGEKAPEVCPTCNHPQSYFEIHAENY